MKFGMFYEHQLPQPWGEDSERRLYQEALAQVELGDKLGIDYVWEVEHHFLEGPRTHPRRRSSSRPVRSARSGSGWAMASC